MKKLLFLVLAVLLLLDSVNMSAQAQQTQTMVGEQTSNPQPQMVDLGLSVKWSNIDLGAATTQSSDEIYPFATDITTMLGKGWRMPTKEEFEELFNNCDKSIQKEHEEARSVVFTSKRNGAQITFYFPETFLSISQPKSITGKNPINRDDCFYELWLWYDGSIKGYVEIRGEDITKNKYKDLWLSVNGNTNFSKWSDEKRKLLKLKKYDFATDQVEYIGRIFLRDNKVVNTHAKISIRPVYSAADDK